ncbi:MAG: hypothetical protein ACXWV0_08210 [Flavisolibacter sp.]
MAADFLALLFLAPDFLALLFLAPDFFVALRRKAPDLEAAFLAPFFAAPFLALFFAADFLAPPFLALPFLAALRDLPEEEPPLDEREDFLAAPFLAAPFDADLPPELFLADFFFAAFLDDFAICDGFCVRLINFLF